MPKRHFLIPPSSLGACSGDDDVVLSMILAGRCDLPSGTVWLFALSSSAIYRSWFSPVVESKGQESQYPLSWFVISPTIVHCYYGGLALLVGLDLTTAH